MADPANVAILAQITNHLQAPEILGDCLSVITPATERYKRKCSVGDPLRIVLLSLVKAGKSTLLNAFLGIEAAYTTPIPATAVMMFCRHTRGPLKLVGLTDVNEELVETDILAVGDAAAVYRQVERVNLAARANPPELNYVGLRLYCPIEMFSGLPEEISSLIELVDAPGAGEYGNPEVETRVKEAIGSADIILLVADSCRIGTQGEASMWEEIRKLRPEVIANFSQRCLCIANRIDALGDGNCTLDNLIDIFLSKLQQGINAVLPRERVIPLSALYGFYWTLNHNQVPLASMRPELQLALCRYLDPQYEGNIPSEDLLQELAPNAPELAEHLEIMAEVSNWAVLRNMLPNLLNNEIVPLRARLAAEDWHYISSTLRTQLQQTLANANMGIQELQAQKDRLVVLQNQLQVFANSAVTDCLDRYFPTLVECTNQSIVTLLGHIENDKAFHCAVADPTPACTPEEGQVTAQNIANIVRSSLDRRVADTLLRLSSQSDDTISKVFNDFKTVVCTAFDYRVKQVDESLAKQFGSINRSHTEVENFLQALQTQDLISDALMQAGIKEYVTSNAWTTQEVRWISVPRSRRVGRWFWRRTVHWTEIVPEYYQVQHVNYPINRQGITNYVANLFVQSINATHQDLTISLEQARRTIHDSMTNALQSPLNLAMQQINTALGLKENAQLSASAKIALMRDWLNLLPIVPLHQ